jgi:putative chitinase
MSDAATTITIGNALLALLVAGLLGMVGQGVRAVAGIKKMGDDAQAKGVSPASVFSPGWFLVSLVIGFIAGVIAGLSLGLSKLLKTPDDMQLLLGIAAAGYAGTDFVEAFSSRLSGGLIPNILPASHNAGAPQPNGRPAQSFPA